MGFQVESGVGPAQLNEIDSANALKSALAKTKLEAGYAVTLGEKDAGSITGFPFRAPFEVSSMRRVRMGIDTLFFNEQWPGAAVDSTKWNTATAAMTATVGSQILVLNAGNSLTSGNSVIVSTRRAFPTWGGSTLWCDVNAQFAEQPIRGNVCEFGFFTATATSIPQFGVFFRLGSDGLLRGCVSRGGSLMQTDPVNFDAVVGFRKMRNYLVGVNRAAVTFWIDDILIGTIPLESQFSAMVLEPNIPFSVRTYNQTATLNAQQLRVGAVNITEGDYHGTKAHEQIMAGMSGGSYQNQFPTTPGSSSNLTNSTGGALPAAAVPTNTTAALGSGLGGWFFETDTFAVNNDGIISSYQVPAIATSSGNKSLYITGIRIVTACTAALTGGGYTAFWSLCFGHTAVSLATAGSATSKAPVRDFVGMMRVAAGAAANVVIGSVSKRFDTPVLVAPGGFIQAVKRKVGTAPSAGTMMHGIFFDGYFE